MRLPRGARLPRLQLPHGPVHQFEGIPPAHARRRSHALLLPCRARARHSMACAPTSWRHRLLRQQHLQLPVSRTPGQRRPPSAGRAASPPRRWPAPQLNRRLLPARRRQWLYCGCAWCGGPRRHRQRRRPPAKYRRRRCRGLKRGRRVPLQRPAPEPLPRVGKHRVGPSQHWCWESESSPCDAGLGPLRGRSGGRAIPGLVTCLCAGLLGAALGAGGGGSASEPRVEGSFNTKRERLPHRPGGTRASCSQATDSRGESAPVHAPV